MPRTFPRPAAAAFGCLLLVGAVGVAGSNLNAAPIGSVRVAAAPSTTTTVAPTTTTSTTVPPTTTTAAPTTTTPKVTTSTTSRSEGAATRVRTRTTVPRIECTYTRTYPDYGGSLITVHIPSLPNRHIHVMISFDNLDLGGTSSNGREAITDASGFAGANFQWDGWMGALRNVMFLDRDGSGMATCTASGPTP